MRLERAIFPFVLIVVLAACRTLPLPLEIDLLANLGDAASGTVETPIAAGSTDASEVRLPDEGERCHVLDDERHGITIVHANLAYELDVAYDGPAITGVVEVQPYLAAHEDALWTEGAALGSPVRVDLAQAALSVGDIVRLDGDQIAALNDRRACVGLALLGTDLSADEDGVASIDYEVKELRLRITFSVF